MRIFKGLMKSTGLKKYPSDQIINNPSLQSSSASLSRDVRQARFDFFR